MKRSLSTVLSRFSLGAFFCVLGLFGLLPNVNESVFSLRDAYQWLEVLFGVIELASGAFLVAAAFMWLSEKTTRSASLVVLIFWLVRIFLTKIVWGLDLSDGIVFLPSFSVWLIVLCVEFIVAAAIFKVFVQVRD
jgi:hypothetical protein